MSERKVLQKYYPPDFDPSHIKRHKKDPRAGNKLQTVRLMAPFSMKCTSCGEFIYKGRKFNSRKETDPTEKYLNIQIFKFHIRCTRCSSEIIFRTNPQTNDYAMVRGAIRTMEPWRNTATAEETTEQRLDRLEAEAADDEDGNSKDPGDPMASLEQKTHDAQQEMAVADALDRLRMRNAAHNRTSIQPGDATAASVEQAALEEQDRLDAEEARRAFQNRATMASVPEVAEEEESDRATATPALEKIPELAVEVAKTSWKPVKKKKKNHAALLGLKPKQ